jgi:hypothetical protein
MAKKRVGDVLLFHDKVVAAEDLVGVPEGTPGKVILKNGFRWIRYRVLFENGTDVGSLDRSQLVLRADWEERQRAEARAAREAELAALRPST